MLVAIGKVISPFKADLNPYKASNYCMEIYATIIIEFILVVSSILILFKLRTKIGLAPLYILLGALQYLQANLGTSFSFKLFEDYVIYPGSIILFSGLLFAVLLIYTKEGVASARALIIGVVLSNIIMSLVFEITYVQHGIISKMSDIVGPMGTFYDINFKYLFSGTVILLVDFLLIVILYQFLISKFKNLPYFLVLLLSLGTILMFDAFAFNLALFYGTPLLKTSLISHIIGKSIAAVFYSLTLYLYIRYLDGEKETTSFIAKQERDIFSIIKYRKQFENLKIEKAKVEKKLTSRLETTLHNISDGFVSLDTNWCYTYLNKKAAEFMGKTPESLIGKHIWTEFPDGVNRSFYKIYHEAVETQKTIYFEDYYEPMDKWFENRVYPSSEGLTIYFTDITEQKKAEITVKESENHVRTILETEPECIKQLNRKGELLYMNPAGLEMIEAENFEMVDGLSVLNLVNSEYKESFKKQIEDVFQGESSKLIFELTGLKGTKRWMETHAVPFKNTKGKIISLLAVTRDITEQRKAEEQIVKNEKLFRDLASNVPVAIFQTDSLGSCNYVNEEWVKYAGRPFEEALGYGWINAIHPDDRERVTKEWKQSVETENEFVSELRFLDKENKITWLSARAVGVHDNQNNLYSYIGMALDITELKNAEEQLVASKRYLDNIINNIGDPVFVKDQNSKFLIANDAFYKFFNRTEEDIIGKTFAEDVPEEKRERYLKADKQVISTGREYADEIELKIKGGESRVILTKKTRFVDEKGNIFLIGVIRDITNRKKAAIELEKHKNNLEELVEKRTAEVNAKNTELQRMNKLFVGRELKMKELKNIIKELQKKDEN
ncbi:PAS domain-containing protein [Algibacter luteus]|uniref:histidine kinase n=1 Tax=Algibacter luteus TaxID=1178825 RepID=A0A1M6AQE2_9FLAO|nr:PAS domain-containing protein [Algibacter luteus]SHI38696.1 PAS domain S-box-containing protein [Algibacter luteus]